MTNKSPLSPQLKLALVFAGVGPLIGAVGFWSYGLVTSLLDRPPWQSPLDVVVSFLGGGAISIALGSYVFGGPPALLTGVLATGLAKLAPNLLTYLVASMIVAGVVSASVLWFWTQNAELTVACTLSGIWAAFVCAASTRRQATAIRAGSFKGFVDVAS